MYVTAAQYLGDEELPSMYSSDRLYVEHYKHIPKINPKNIVAPKQYVSQPVQPRTEIMQKPGLNLKWVEKTVKNTADPKVWGPAYWTVQHISAAHYPKNASQIVRAQMKARILAVPHEIPCVECKKHASAFIQSKLGELDNIVSGKDSLGKFWVDFHNKVNERHGKRKWTYEEAYNKYSGGATVLTLQSS